jgi:hypothetical protein
MKIKYTLPNGQSWTGTEVDALSPEDCIGLNRNERERVLRIAMAADDLGVQDVHFGDGARLRIIDEEVEELAFGMDVFKEMGMESPYESSLFNR